ncbi:MAG: hypothetical protein Q7T84_14575 [Phenylobacterium sp.]|uniref:hypothetical protein n=1 Tax=Phenylobacterium sp. TaxID=1871053 RepID=UPI00272436ED|nr:hypothetical protein [Phenylobacterium sp.]MDO9432522.1 hypothetical protein [Phenylobacterium sp.]
MPETPTFGRRKPMAYAPPAPSQRAPSLAELGVAPSDGGDQELEAWRKERREKRRSAYLRQITGLSGIGVGLMLCSLILKLADLDLLSAIPGTLGSICMFIGWRRNRASS